MVLEAKAYSYDVIIFLMGWVMSKVVVVNHSNERSLELRAQRKVSFSISAGEADIIDILSAEHVVVVTSSGVPSFLGRVSDFRVSAGGAPKKITAEVEDLTDLWSGWTKVSQVIGDKSIVHAKTVELDTEELYSAGKKISSEEDDGEGRQNVLVAQDAAIRLAWTYGVEVSQVKISIEL